MKSQGRQAGEPLPLVTAVVDPAHPLMARRRALVEQLADVDRQIAAEASTTMRIALVAATASSPALPAASDATKLLPASASRREATPGRRAGAVASAVKHEREIKTALVPGAQSARAIAKQAGLKREVVTHSLKQLRTLGQVVKNGDRGPSVTWQLATGTRAAVATARPAVTTTSTSADEFDTVWPPKHNPRASLAETLQPGARA